MLCHKLIKGSVSVLASLPLLISLVSCQSDRLTIPPKEEYAREFLKQFGVPDMDSGWNAASRVRGEISPSLLSGAAKVEILSSWPSTPGCKLVASFESLSGEFHFDYPRDLRYAYVQITDKSGTVTYGRYHEIKDGMLRVGTDASRTGEGAGQIIYAYDLTDHPAMGTFPFDEDYNREFWKKLGIWKEPVVDYGPEDLDTGTIHTVWTEEIKLNWSPDWSVKNSFAEAQSNVIELIVKFRIDDYSEGPQFIFCDGDGVEYDIIGSGVLQSDSYPIGIEHEISLKANSFQTAKLKSLALLKGTGITLLEIAYRNLPYEKVVSQNRADISSLFHLYGLTNRVKAGSFEEFRNNALGPNHELDKTGYSVADLVSLVGREKGVMHEEIDQITHQCNLMRFRDKLKPQDGVDYKLAEDGPVTIDYFFGSASTFNCLGYFYYSDEEAHLGHEEFVEMLLRKPKFLIVYRACPGYNVHIKRTEDSEWEEQSKLADFVNPDGTFNGNNIILEHGEDEGKDKSDNWKHCMEFTSLVDEAEDIISAGNPKPEYPRLRSANYRLTYFDPSNFEKEEDGRIRLKNTDVVGSDIFPKGTHIAFFVINGGQYAFRRNGEAGFKLDNRRISFSRPFLNKYLGNVFNEFGHSHHPNSDPNMPSVNVPGIDAHDAWTPFVTYSWAGRITMGVEDYFARTQDGINGGDHDMNDMIFSVNGKFERERPNIDPNRPEYPSWIVACEDLGGTYDFDFNDVVFGVSHVAGSTTAKVTALASGGTLPVHILSKYPTVNKGESSNVTVGDKSFYKLIPEGTNDGEFHSWWGASRPHNAAINVDREWVEGRSVEISVPEDFSVSSGDKYTGNVIDADGNMGGFRVLVTRDGKEYNVIKAPNPDADNVDIEFPQMFLVDNSWLWPVERQHIQDVYMDFFEWKGSWWTNRNGLSSDNVIHHKWAPVIPDHE